MGGGAKHDLELASYFVFVADFCRAKCVIAISSHSFNDSRKAGAASGGAAPPRDTVVSAATPVCEACMGKHRKHTCGDTRQRAKA